MYLCADRTGNTKRQIAVRLMVIALFSVALSLALSVGQRAQAAACPKEEIWCECAGKCISMNNICLLEPINNVCEIVSGGSPFDQYLNGAWSWAFGMGVAICVLQVVISGFMMSVQGAAGVEAAKQRIMWAIAGLLILLLAGALLSFINPIGFSQS